MSNSVLLATSRPPFHTDGDERGIRASAVVAPTESPAMNAFHDALDELCEFVSEDAIQAGSALPSGRGCYGPDTTTLDRLQAAVVEAARRAFGAPAAAVPTERVVDSGLFTVHNPDARLCISSEGAQQ